MESDNPFRQALKAVMEREEYDEIPRYEFEELSGRDRAMAEAGAVAALRIIPSFPSPSTPATFRIRHADDENNPCAGVIHGVLDDKDNLILDCQNCSTTVQLNV